MSVNIKTNKNYIKIIFISLIFLYQTLQAKDSQELNNDIKELLVKIQKADSSQKRVLINQLKAKVRTINKLKKIKIIKIIKDIKKSLNQRANMRYKNLLL